MKKTPLPVIAVTCLLIISASVFTLLTPPTIDSIKIQSEKDMAATTPLSNAPSSQVSQLGVITYDNASDSSKSQLEQVLNQDQSTIGQTAANQSEVYQPALPLPFPDGRIFMRANTGTEEPIPYIPTQYPKEVTPPIIPSELDI